MRFDIRYQMNVEYENVVRHSHNELRVCPVSDHDQVLLSYRVHASPSIRVHSFTDYWATRVDAYGIREPHVAVELIAESTVETSRRLPAVATPPVAALADPVFRDPKIEYLVESRHTGVGPRVAALVAEIDAVGHADVASVIRAVQDRVHAAVAYETGSTDIGVTPDEVLKAGTGVCQDFAHLAVAICRGLQVPARYVSGYFFATDDATGAGEAEAAVAVQTHAWFEAAIPGGGWLALDPTNALAVGERHVTIGRGRDYDDVPPIRGVYAGTAAASMQAGVTMRRLPEAQGQQQHQQQQ